MKFFEGEDGKMWKRNIKDLGGLPRPCVNTHGRSHATRACPPPGPPQNMHAYTRTHTHTRVHTLAGEVLLVSQFTLYYRYKVIFFPSPNVIARGIVCAYVLA